jgi:hypothetical protein
MSYLIAWIWSCLGDRRWPSLPREYLKGGKWYGEMKSNWRSWEASENQQQTQAWGPVEDMVSEEQSDRSVPLGGEVQKI